MIVKCFYVTFEDDAEPYLHHEFNDFLNYMEGINIGCEKVKGDPNPRYVFTPKDKTDAGFDSAFMILWRKYRRMRNMPGIVFSDEVIK